MVREAQNRHLGVGVRNLIGVDPGDVRNDKVRRVDAFGRDETMAAEGCLKLAAEKEIDAREQDRRHLSPSVTLRLVEEDLRRGLDQIRRGEYFEAHESLEDAWRAADSAEKDFFQGLVHVAVAWYQAGRGNRTGCERQLEKAARRLAPFAPAHRGVNVEFLLREIRDAALTVAGGSLELLPVSLPGTEKPYGCSVIVWRAGEHGREYLILHRRTVRGAAYDGDWAWTPPSGARDPGEHPDVAAARELREETGLELSLTRTDLGTREWSVYVAQAPPDASVVLDEEHDRFRWTTAEEAEGLCLPAMVGQSIGSVETDLGLEGP
jgi:predicted metal-dependent hydrolase/8-oxo-dGTP pyrophosphatase MutT (NUDIX family)